MIKQSWDAKTEIDAMKNLLAKLQLKTAELLESRHRRGAEVMGSDVEFEYRRGFEVSWKKM
jgi:hypothetical protein